MNTVAVPHWPDCAMSHGGSECDMGRYCGCNCGAYVNNSAHALACNLGAEPNAVSFPVWDDWKRRFAMALTSDGAKRELAAAAMLQELRAALQAAVDAHGCGAGLGKCDASWCVKARTALSLLAQSAT